MNKIIIVGGGAAGLMAAGQAAKRGLDVSIIERNARPARKLLITGKGRCNITNATFEITELLENIPTNSRFLYSAFNSFMTYDTIDFFENLGVAVKIERGNRVFPVTDKAVTVVDALVKFAKDNGVKIINARVAAIKSENKRITGVILEDKTVIDCDGVVVATGGCSYPQTGSTGDGYSFARAMGHTVTPLVPSLVPLDVHQGWCSDLQGLSLKNAAIKIVNNDSGKTLFTDFGEMMFTHFGVTGPMILSASAHIRDIGVKHYSLYIDLKPALSDDQLDRRIIRDFAENPNRDFINSLGALLPNKMVPVVVRLSKIEPSLKANQITKEMRKNLVTLLKNMKLDITSFRPIDEAIITSGGVHVNEINPKSMESKLIKNLHFAGEVIDVDAYTGGFNLQIAFSTAYLAGKKILEDELQ